MQRDHPPRARRDHPAARQIARGAGQIGAGHVKLAGGKGDIGLGLPPRLARQLRRSLVKRARGLHGGGLGAVQPGL